MRKLLTTFRPLRTVAAVAVIAAGLIGLAAGARAADTLRVGKSVPEPFSFTPLDIGMQKGFFKSMGWTFRKPALPVTRSSSRPWRPAVSTLG